MESTWVVRQARRYGAGVALVVCLEGAMPPLFAAEVATAEDAVAPANNGPVTAEGDGRRTLRRLPANLGGGALGVFNHDNVGPALAGAATSAVSSLWDDEVRADLAKNPAQLDWGSTLETAGGPLYSTIFVAGMFVGGRFSHGRFRAATYDMLDASIVNLAYTEVLKVAVGRERPNGEDNKSFPSGHTSNAFALAAVAERHYGWKIGVPAYLLAGCRRRLPPARGQALAERRVGRGDRGLPRGADRRAREQSTARSPRWPHDVEREPDRRPAGARAAGLDPLLGQGGRAVLRAGAAHFPDSQRGRPGLRSQPSVDTPMCVPKGFPPDQLAMPRGPLASPIMNSNNRKVASSSFPLGVRET